MGEAPLRLRTLPLDVLLLVVSHTPVDDYYNLKRVGNWAITMAVRDACSLLSRGKYSPATPGGRWPPPTGPHSGGPGDHARDQPALVLHQYLQNTPAAAEPRQETARIHRSAAPSQHGATTIIHPVLDRLGPLAWTALHLAALNGQADMIRLLVARGAEISAVDGHGKTALQLALENNQAEAARVLNANSAAANVHEVVDVHGREWVNLRGGPRGGPGKPQGRVTSKREWMSISLREYLVGANINARDHGGYTKLHLTAFNARDDDDGRDGNSALHLALKTSPQLVRLFVQHGADINDKWRWPHPLHTLLLKRQVAEFLHLLLEHGADPHALIKGGADVDAQDGQDRTPLHYVVMQT
ncbi:hypothetical protein VTO42DRAFT_3793 [Malbranchea cinnamomea]